MTGRMKKLTSLATRIAALAVVGGFWLADARSASADDQGWMFRHSYFSHVMPPEIQARYPVPESRSAYRRPIVNLSPGFGVRGVYRPGDVTMLDTGHTAGHQP